MLKKIAIGTVQFGCNYGISNTRGQTTTKEAQSIVSLATKKGIKIYDTAPSYGDSEFILGEILPKDTKIITKITI